MHFAHTSASDAWSFCSVLYARFGRNMFEISISYADTVPRTQPGNNKKLRETDGGAYSLHKSRSNITERDLSSNWAICLDILSHIDPPPAPRWKRRHQTGCPVAAYIYIYCFTAVAGDVWHYSSISKSNNMPRQDAIYTATTWNNQIVVGGTYRNKKCADFTNSICCQPQSAIPWKTPTGEMANRVRNGLR